MNMSLNIPQEPKKRGGARPGTGGNRPGAGRRHGSCPKMLAKVRDYVLSQRQLTGQVPTNVEMATVLEYSYPSIVRAWRYLIAEGQLPAILVSEREDQKSERARRARAHQGTVKHSGDCTPEMANKIFQLLRNDLEARILWHKMRAGHLPKVGDT